MGRTCGPLIKSQLLYHQVVDDWLLATLDNAGQFLGSWLARLLCLFVGATGCEMTKLLCHRSLGRFIGFLKDEIDKGLVEIETRLF